MQACKPEDDDQDQLNTHEFQSFLQSDSLTFKSRDTSHEAVDGCLTHGCKLVGVLPFGSMIVPALIAPQPYNIPQKTLADVPGFSTELLLVVGVNVYFWIHNQCCVLSVILASTQLNNVAPVLWHQYRSSPNHQADETSCDIHGRVNNQRELPKVGRFMPLAP